MKARLFLCCAGLSIMGTGSAQLLERKGSLGARLEPVSDGRGVRVVEVLPQGSAAGIGLKAGDELLVVNGTEVTTVGDLVQEVGQWRNNQVLTVTALRNARSVKHKGRVVGKPLETSEHGEVSYGEVPFDGGALRSILIRPTGVTRPPVILWLPGVGCYSQDLFASPRSPYKLWVEGIVAHGIAVYRVEKPGMGDSRNNTPCEEMDFDHEVEAYRTALKHLHNMPDIDADRIFLYGHSMGVLSAPLVAAAAPVAGIIAWGGVATTWFEYEMKLIREQQRLEGKDVVAIEADLRAKLPLLADFYLAQRTPEELARVPAYAEVLADYTEGGLWHGLMHYSFFHDVGRLDILSAYRSANCPVFTLAGEFDLHTVDTSWAATIADAVNAARPATAESRIVKGTTHHYHTVPSMHEYVAMQEAGTLDQRYMADHFNAEVPTLVAQWVLGSR
jgi:pimeloyl-ACP methyl ester carboxylesterase